MTRRRVCAVMVFADDPESVARWYADALETEGAQPVPDGPAWLLETGDVEVVFHPADASKNPPGASTVAYWTTESVARDRVRLSGLGATLHRGPLTVTPGRTICQLRDPWGNVFGLDGPP